MAYKNIHEELNMLMPFSPDVKVQQSQREQMAVMGFLAALPSEDDLTKTQILSSPKISSLQKTLSRILRTEYHPFLHLPLYLPRQAVVLLDRTLSQRGNEIETVVR